MFLFTRPNNALQRFFQGRMDMHCHILPGVDDGPKNIESSRNIIEGLREVGFKGAWCTPHVMAAYPDNTPDNLQRLYTEICGQLDLDGFELRLAAEYMLDEEFAGHLERGAMLSYDGRRVLVELPQLMLPLNWMDLIFKLQAKGYIPVFAHPERYLGILSFDQLANLHDMGLEFQLNLPSLAGMYGKDVRRLSLRLLKGGYYDHMGTDSHSVRQSMLLREIPKKQLEQLCKTISGEALESKS